MPNTVRVNQEDLHFYCTEAFMPLNDW